jgi:hypothetical protein
VICTSSLLAGSTLTWQRISISYARTTCSKPKDRRKRIKQRQFATSQTGIKSGKKSISTRGNLTEIPDQVLGTCSESQILKPLVDSQNDWYFKNRGGAGQQSRPSPLATLKANITNELDTDRRKNQNSR